MKLRQPGRDSEIHPHSPSFKGLIPASDSSSSVKRKNRAIDTKHEIELRRLLWATRLRFRKNVKGLPGKPDIVFLRQKVAIFCDGDFWHGRDWDRLSGKLSAGHNSNYWLKKVQANRDQDIRTNIALTQQGWLVLRFWETDIQNRPFKVVREITDALQKQDSSKRA